VDEFYFSLPYQPQTVYADIEAKQRTTAYLYAWPILFQELFFSAVT
jgi:hypothetical protein